MFNPGSLNRDNENLNQGSALQVLKFWVTVTCQAAGDWL